jgi:hypothetical protein
MKKAIAVILSACVFSACTKIITLDLNTAPAQLVIQGTVSDTAGPSHVYLSNSVGFYADNVYPTVSGATITITDSTTNTVDQLTEDLPGDYVSHNITGVPGHTYLLNVQLNGKTYTASSTMPQPVDLDSVGFDHGIASSKHLNSVAYFQDPVGVHNYYKMSNTINGKYVARFNTFDDRLSDGRYLNLRFDNDTADIHVGDLVQMNLTCIDAGAYTWLNESEQIAYDNSNLAAPATPTSNITGGVLGYFSAQTVRSKAAIAHN